MKKGIAPLRHRLWHISLATVLLAIALQFFGEYTRSPSFVNSMNNKINMNPYYGMCYNGRPLLDPKARYCDQAGISFMQRIVALWKTFMTGRTFNPHYDKFYEGTTLSVIMPFHNLGSMTCQSLYELVKDSLHFQTEFILVSDGSEPAEVKKVTKCINKLKGKFLIEFRILENKVSMGYGPACNLGAEHAGGTLLLFANNDMFVGNGALHAMIHTILNFPEAGVVGPLFLGRDMIIQELGGVIYQDASAANGYRHHEAVPSQLLMSHDVDYISAACLMVRKADFHALNGFDVIYGRGYYEDTDLAMGIRQLGKRVILQPFAIVFHQEGNTFGSDTPEKKILMNRNKKMFFTKWKKELKLFSPPGTPPIESRERYNLNPILWADQYFITPSHDSGSQRNEQILRYLLDAGFQITFLPMTAVATEDIMPSIARMRFNGVRILTDIETTICDEQTNECRFNLIFIARPFTFRDIQQDLNSCCKGVPRIYDTVDLHFLRETREKFKFFEINKSLETDELVDIVTCGRYTSQIEAENCLELDHNLTGITISLVNQVRWLYSLLRLELNSIMTSDITLVVSEDERRVLSKVGVPRSKLRILSNIYPDSRIYDAFKSISGPRQSRKVGAIFVGNMQHVPNIGAVEHLIDITKHVARVYPDFKMHIVGSHTLPSHMADRIRLVKNIVLHGWLSDENLNSLYNDVICAFVPLSTGAGVKGKVASAYLHSVPVVGSRIATEGMGLKDGHDYLLAEKPDEYLKAYSYLRANPQYLNELTKHGLQVIRDRMSFSTAAKNLSSVFSELGFYIPKDTIY